MRYGRHHRLPPPPSHKRMAHDQNWTNLNRMYACGAWLFHFFFFFFFCVCRHTPVRPPVSFLFYFDRTRGVGLTNQYSLSYYTSLRMPAHLLARSSIKYCTNNNHYYGYYYLPFVLILFSMKPIIRLTQNDHIHEFFA